MLTKYLYYMHICLCMSRSLDYLFIKHYLYITPLFFFLNSHSATEWQPKIFSEAEPESAWQLPGSLSSKKVLSLSDSPHLKNALCLVP